MIVAMLTALRRVFARCLDVLADRCAVWLPCDDGMAGHLQSASASTVRQDDAFDTPRVQIGCGVINGRAIFPFGSSVRLRWPHLRLFFRRICNLIHTRSSGNQNDAIEGSGPATWGQELPQGIPGEIVAQLNNPIRSNGMWRRNTVGTPTWSRAGITFNRL